MNAGLLTVLIAMLGGAIRVSTPFMFVAVGECLTEKSGRVNLGLGVIFGHRHRHDDVAFLAGHDRRGRQAEPGQRGPGAGARGGELAAPLGHGAGDRGLPPVARGPPRESPGGRGAGAPGG